MCARARARVLHAACVRVHVGGRGGEGREGGGGGGAEREREGGEGGRANERALARAALFVACAGGATKVGWGVEGIGECVSGGLQTDGEH